MYPFDKQRFIENSNDLAFDYDEYTPGKRVYSMTDFLSVIASDDILEIDGKDKMRILYAFWGKADKNRLDLLYDKIKTVWSIVYCYYILGWLKLCCFFYLTFRWLWDFGDSYIV